MKIPLESLVSSTVNGMATLDGESILVNNDGCDLEIFSTTNSAIAFEGSKKCRISLTTGHMVFQSIIDDDFKCFSVPIARLRAIDVEQPIFGSNYISGVIMTDVCGLWKEEASFRIWFKKGGAIDFCNALLYAAQVNFSRSHVPRSYDEIVGIAPPPYEDQTAPESDPIPREEPVLTDVKVTDATLEQPNPTTEQMLVECDCTSSATGKLEPKSSDMQLA